MASYDYLEDFFKSQLQGTNPIFDQLLGTGQRRIGRQVDKNVTNIEQQNAQSGFRGVGANQINDAHRTGSDALSQLLNQIMMQKLQQQNQGAEGLMGIEDLKAQEFGWGDLFGSLLSGGAQVGAAALTGGTSLAGAGV